MKNILLCLSLLLLFTGCKKEGFGTGFEINYIVDIEVDAGLSPLLSHSYTLQNYPVNLQTKTENEGFTLADITKINAKALRMDMITPAGGNYQFLERIYLEISTATKGAAEVGYLEFIPNNQGGSLSFVPSQTDIIDYLKEEDVDLTLKIDPIAPPPYTTSNRLDLTFHVSVE